MPLDSVVVHAKTSDSQMLLPSLKRMKELDIQFPNLVADMGYIDGQDKIDAHKLTIRLYSTKPSEKGVHPFGFLICFWFFVTTTTNA